MGQYYLAYDMNNQPYFGHSGVKGMKWGERRWQNYDGSLTPAGRVHYGYADVDKQSTQETNQKQQKMNKPHTREKRIGTGPVTAEKGDAFHVIGGKIAWLDELSLHNMDSRAEDEWNNYITNAMAYSDGLGDFEEDEDAKRELERIKRLQKEAEEAERLYKAGEIGWREQYDMYGKYADAWSAFSDKYLSQYAVDPNYELKLIEPKRNKG